MTTHETLADILRACVAYGGDVDTVAAIALAAASCPRDVSQNLLAWTPLPGARGDGFFIQPKLGGMWSYEEDRAEGERTADANRRTRGGQLTLDLDLGYRKTTARSSSYLAVVFGAGVGYSWNQRRKELDLGAQYDAPWGDARRNGRIFDINMDLLRVGFSF